MSAQLHIYPEESGLKQYMTAILCTLIGICMGWAMNYVSWELGAQVQHESIGYHKGYAEGIRDAAGLAENGIRFCIDRLGPPKPNKRAPKHP